MKTSDDVHKALGKVGHIEMEMLRNAAFLAQGGQVKGSSPLMGPGVLECAIHLKKADGHACSS